MRKPLQQLPVQRDMEAHVRVSYCQSAVVRLPSLGKAGERARHAPLKASSAFGAELSEQHKKNRFRR